MSFDWDESRRAFAEVGDAFVGLVARVGDRRVLPLLLVTTGRSQLPAGYTVL